MLKGEFQERYYCWIWMLRQFWGTLFFLVHDSLFGKFPCVFHAQTCWFDTSVTCMLKFRQLSELLWVDRRLCLSWFVMLVIWICHFEGEISSWSTTIPLRRNSEFHTKSTSGPDRIWEWFEIFEIARCTSLNCHLVLSATPNASKPWRRTTNGQTQILFSILNSHSYSTLVQVVWLNVPLTLAELAKLTTRECHVINFLLLRGQGWKKLGPKSLVFCRPLRMPLKCQGLRTCTKQFRGIGEVSTCRLSCEKTVRKLVKLRTLETVVKGIQLAAEAFRTILVGSGCPLHCVAGTWGSSLDSCSGSNFKGTLLPSCLAFDFWRACENSNKEIT